MEGLELKWLGPPQVKLDGGPVRLETRKVTALLAVLSLEGRPQSREYLAALLWPEFDSRRAPANLISHAATNKGQRILVDLRLVADQ